MFEQLANIEHKERFRCEVKGYLYAHSHMYVWCAGIGGRFYIRFDSVEYFSCPKSWKGLYLSKGSDAECWEKLVLFKRRPDDVSLREKNPNTLFKFKIGDTFAEIIASDAWIQKERK